MDKNKKYSQMREAIYLDIEIEAKRRREAETKKKQDAERLRSYWSRKR